MLKVAITLLLSTLVAGLLVFVSLAGSSLAVAKYFAFLLSAPMVLILGFTGGKKGF